MKSQKVNIEGRELSLTHLDKVFYPETGFTKGQLIDYYARIAPVLLPHLKDRPVTLKRYPDGVEGKFFYEKRAPKYKPAWLKTAAVPSKTDPTGKINYCLLNDLPSLIWAANSGNLELHTFLAKKQNVQKPTQIVFDLDPGAPADVRDCAEVAFWIKELLGKFKLTCLIKSTGSKGLQVHIPLNTPTSYEVTKSFARGLAAAMEQAYPDRIVHDMKKTLREGKVLIDWSQNDPSKTTVNVYSLRARPRPFVAAPLEWDEVGRCANKGDSPCFFLEVEEVLARVKKRGDVFAALLTQKQKLPRDWAAQLSNFVPADSTRKNAKTAGKPSSSVQLRVYKEKRNFQSTGEPEGGHETWTDEDLYVVQKHAASRLHYDFRLAMGGALKSWAVPKGIPLVPGEKHLAVEVEDHPMEYARFEGIIPMGNYGAGTVMVWDTGRYQSIGKESLEAWKEGKLNLHLDGQKLKGEWTLVRLKKSDSDKHEWLLLKTGKHASPLEEPDGEEISALSGRTMSKIRQDRDATWESDSQIESGGSTRKATGKALKTAEAQKGDGPKRRPRFVEPMKCLPVDSIPTGADWLYELKFDGYRALASCREGEVILLSRNRNDLTPRFPALASALLGLPVADALLDGEIVALDQDSRPSFQALQSYQEGQPLAYYFFDLIFIDGQDWRGRPLSERRLRLKNLLHGIDSPIFFSNELLGSAQKIWDEIRKQRFEGLVAKRRSSLYEPGKWSGQWVKIKAVARQEFVIGGYTQPKGARLHFGALLVGTFEKNGLQFCGKVGTGFDQRLLSSLHERMDKLRVTHCPFSNLKAAKSGRFFGGITASELKDCVWLKPELVCEVQFSEWTDEGSLRHPSFLGLRDDVSAAGVHRELWLDGE